ncbi:phage protein NinX family protein [Paraburkholderia gardini]|uniref:DUF2591 domain-containing protein n=1 Tax=Paraburkholderia gardini TaxID=2823469 RepID=A0ABM8U7N1_9BURK|nr:phage protein NinX family protein [Paraburkholderia gardini]CAG4905698.1 hypothetical protein R69919_03319 [Paraburkholderia gardini]CAG4912790.1 hypothetical protein R54767_03933 [Paraburkholderia gardini]
MNVADLTDVALDYWVARSLHDFVREIHFTDSGRTVAIRGTDRGRPWDGRFTPSASWEAAALVLDRARQLELAAGGHGTDAHCVADFEGGLHTVEGRGESTRTALLRAFVASRFGDTVADDMLRQSQALAGVCAEVISEALTPPSAEDMPTPNGRIGDIQSAPR